ncbi:hypothetical protein BH23GEM10_BH23GEM10_14780 [soil metagenome]
MNDAMLRSVLSALLAACALASCTVRAAEDDVPARVIPGEEWRAEPALGHAADANRRNVPPGGTLEFRDFAIDVLAAAADVAELRLRHDDVVETRAVAEGAAFNWNGYHIAVVAIPGPGELGAGLVSLEVATVASLPAHVAASTVAGAAALRLRVPHEITHITLHHTGSPQPLRPEDDPVRGLRGLQSWGASDRNWWDVPYHYLLDLDGNVYEGRDWRYMGETNTTYDPAGHFLISVLGNYELQRPTAAQLDAIADMMAWAVQRFDVPLERIGGHYHYAETSCPGEHLRPYLEDGTLRRMVAARLH